MSDHDELKATSSLNLVLVKGKLLTQAQARKLKAEEDEAVRTRESLRAEAAATGKRLYPNEEKK